MYTIEETKEKKHSNSINLWHSIIKFLGSCARNEVMIIAMLIFA